MIEHFIYMLPLLILLFGSTIFACKKFATDDTPQCFKLCRLTIAVSFAFSIIFYNRPMLVGLSSANHLTSILLSWLFVNVFIILYLARKWFNGIKQSGDYFCSGIIFATIAGCLLIISKNIVLTAGAVILLIAVNIRMLQKYSDSLQNLQFKNIYTKSALWLIIMLLAATAKLYFQAGSGDYEIVQNMLHEKQSDFITFGASCILVLAFMFLLAAAPLHYWLIYTAAKMSLPILIYFLLLVPTVAFACLIRLDMLMLSTISGSLQILYCAIGFMSVFVGAVGACGSINIRQMLAYTLVFFVGIDFIILQHLTLDAVQTAIVYWFFCWLALCGICITLFCFKNKGEYLLQFDQFANAAYKKPYAALIMTLLFFSLLGLPPLTGSLGLFAVLNELAAHNCFYSLIYVLLMLLILSYAYLNVIQKIYFENSRNNFDRTGFDIYILLFAIVALMIFVALQPHYLIGNLWMAEIFYG